MPSKFTTPLVSIRLFAGLMFTMTPLIGWANASMTELISLSRAKQTLAGIETQVLQNSQYQPEAQAVAHVVDIQPLLASRQQYFAARIEVANATKALTLTQQALQRTQMLFESGVQSQRQWQEQQLRLSDAQARLASSQFMRQSILDNLTTQWGNTVSQWATTANHSHFSSFVNGQQALLLVSVPAGQTLPADVTHIDIDANGNRQTPQRAYFIAAAPQVSAESQGETYYFRTARAKLRTGMRLSAWIAKPTQALTGFIIPTSAVVWHAAQASIYLKTAAEQFKRYALQQYYPVTGGYFVAQTIPPTTEVVSTGAQVLLSYEFRALIPTEDDADDD